MKKSELRNLIKEEIKFLFESSEMSFDSEEEANEFKKSMEKGPFKVTLKKGKKIFNPIKNIETQKHIAIVKKLEYKDTNIYKKYK